MRQFSNLEMLNPRTGKFLLRADTAMGGPFVELFAVGDIVLDREVKNVISRSGPYYPFYNVRGLFEKGDIVFGNLESPVSAKKETAVIKKRIHFCGIPSGIIGLRYAGFNILNIGNNHIMDFGKEALRETIKTLQHNAIGFIGAGENLCEARSPYIIQSKGVSVGLLGYSSPDVETNAGDNSAGTAPSELSIMLEDVSRLKEGVDIVVVSIHRGLEFVYYPIPVHQVECRTLVEAGASAVLCHHPHVPQGVEFYKGGVIAYSLGEFVSDFEEPLTGFEKSLFLKTRKECFFLKVRFDRRGAVDGEIFPRILDDNFQVVLPAEEERIECLRLVGRLSHAVESGRLKKIFWKKAKNYLILQSSAMLLRPGKLKIRDFISFCRWAASDRVFMMIAGTLLRIEPPGFVVTAKNAFIKLFIVVPCRFIFRTLRKG